MCAGGDKFLERRTIYGDPRGASRDVNIAAVLLSRGIGVLVDARCGSWFFNRWNVVTFFLFVFVGSYPGVNIVGLLV